MSEEWPDALWILQNLNYLLGIQLEDMTVEYLKNVTNEQVINAMQEAYSPSKILAKDMGMTKRLLQFLQDLRNGLVDEKLINDIIQQLIRKRDNNYSQKFPKTEPVNSLLLELYKLI
jgi:hypothetical protein